MAHGLQSKCLPVLPRPQPNILTLASLRSIRRANGICEKILAEFEPPPGPAIREQLDAFSERRGARGGAPME